MIKQLFNEGYKYLYIPKRNKKTFYATKADCNFYDDDTSYDEFLDNPTIQDHVQKIY